MKAKFGWTVVAKGGGNLDPNEDIIFVYRRDCPPDGLAADFAPFTFATKAEAVAAGKRGVYAYKR